MKARRAALLFLATIAGCTLIGAWGLGSLLMRPSPSAVPAAVAPAQDLTIATPDGLSLAATLWSGRTPDGPAVLLLHGQGASRAATRANAAWLAGLGYEVLTIDFRGHGQSSPATPSFGPNEAIDVRAALARLRQRGHVGRIGVIGISLGGAACLTGDDGPIDADALVLQAVYPDIRRAIRNRIASLTGPLPAVLLEPLLSWQSVVRLGRSPSQMAPVVALARYAGPVLIIGGRDDRYTPEAETREMYEAAPGPKSLWIATGLDHAGMSDAQSDAYRSRVLAFFTETIGSP